MNLIVTCARHMEYETRDELRRLLGGMGDDSAEIAIIKEMSGILVASTALDPVEVSREMREMVLEEPWSIRYCMRVIPVQREVDTSPEAIREAAVDLASRISEGETYRISVERRNTDVSADDIIKGIAGGIPNRVSLESPDKVILVEILGERAGVSVIRQSDVLSVEKAKRSISE